MPNWNKLSQFKVNFTKPDIALPDKLSGQTSYSLILLFDEDLMNNYTTFGRIYS